MGKYDPRSISNSNNARIENSCIIPKMQESGTLRTKICARMLSFSCEDDKKLFTQKRSKNCNSISF